MSVGEIPDPVRRLALHSFWELPPIPGTVIVERGHYRAFLHRLPIPQIVEPLILGPDDVDAAVIDIRALVREHCADLLAWWTGVDHPWLADQLQVCGLRNEDASGFESVENAMALARPPTASSHPSPDLQITEVTTLEDFAGQSVFASMRSAWHRTYGCRGRRNGRSLRRVQRRR